MATPRLSMRKTKEILRQKWLLERSNRAVAASAGVGTTTVCDTERRARAARLTWADVSELTEEALEARLYPPAAPSTQKRQEPDWSYVHAERKRPGVTLELLHLEYVEQHPDGLRYSSFCQHYQAWAKARGITMRQVHRAGEKLFVDYAGQRPHIQDSATGERIDVELFVAVLGASNYTYAEATRTQRSADFIASHVRALQFLGGVPAAIVPDQLKSGISSSCRYEPAVQRTYEELAAHYGTTVLPARPAHPRDKAKVEVGVQVAERWILARLRNQTFFTLEALNERIAELLEELNARTMRVYKSSRRELFDKLDQPALQPLPATAFAYGEWKKARVNIDYHVELDGHYYSAPHRLIHEEVEVRSTAATVEIYRRGQRVGGHVRSYQRGRHTTVAEHMPKAHQKHAEWTPSRMIEWAATIGPQTKQLIEAILETRVHPEQGYRSCLGVLRLAKKYSAQRLEKACERALVAGARSYRHVESILKHGLDRQPLAPAAETPAIRHGNVRGPDYYN